MDAMKIEELLVRLAKKAPPDETLADNLEKMLGLNKEDIVLLVEALTRIDDGQPHELAVNCLMMGGLLAIERIKQ